MIRFFPVYERPTLKGQLIYVRADASFDFEQADPTEHQSRIQMGVATPILIGTLQIEIGIDTGLAVYIWGYYPDVRWRIEALHDISGLVSPGTFEVKVDEGLYVGEAVRYVEINEWPTSYDPLTGWVCIGNQDVTSTTHCIEFASNTVAVIEDDKLQALWLRPKFE